jgi:chromosome segregation ATPase
MAALRRWQVPELGIKQIGSNASTNVKGKTEEVQHLLGELVELTGECKHLASTKVRAPPVKPEDRVATLEKEAQEQGLRLEALSIQLHEVSHERDQLKLSQASTSKALSDAHEELSNVRRQLNHLAASGKGPSLVLAEKRK